VTSASAGRHKGKGGASSAPTRCAPAAPVAEAPGFHPKRAEARPLAGIGHRPASAGLAMAWGHRPRHRRYVEWLLCKLVRFIGLAFWPLYRLYRRPLWSNRLLLPAAGPGGVDVLSATCYNASRRAALVVRLPPGYLGLQDRENSFRTISENVWQRAFAPSPRA